MCYLNLYLTTILLQLELRQRQTKKFEYELVLKN